MSASAVHRGGRHYLITLALPEVHGPKLLNESPCTTRAVSRRAYFTTSYPQEEEEELIVITIVIGAFINLSKSIQSAAGLKALKPAGNGRLLNVRIIFQLFTFTVQKYIYLFVMI